MADNKVIEYTDLGGTHRFEIDPNSFIVCDCASGEYTDRFSFANAKQAIRDIVDDRGGDEYCSDEFEMYVRVKMDVSVTKKVELDFPVSAKPVRAQQPIPVIKAVVACPCGCGMPR